MFYNHQYGFRLLHDCQQPLLHYTEQVRHSLNPKRGLYSLSVFIDLKKAFDTIPFNLLLDKLNFYGVEGTSLSWFKSYLTDRSQVVELDGVRSHSRVVQMGVPQGSVVGPLLFLVYINDLPNCLEYSIPYLFADDTTIVKTGTDLAKLYQDMKNELCRLQDWCMANKLSLNEKN